MTTNPINDRDDAFAARAIMRSHDDHSIANRADMPLAHIRTLRAAINAMTPADRAAMIANAQRMIDDAR